MTSSDILTTFQLDKELDCSKVIVIKEINGCDSLFITNSVLGHCVKNKTAVFVISTHNSVQHYHNVGLKMNYNLQKSLDSGLVTFYDAGQELLNSIIENNPLTPREFWLKIKEKLLELRKKFNCVHVICDGVSHLYDMQFNVKQLNDIFKELIILVRNFNNSFLILHCNIVNDDDVTNALANLLIHKAQILCEVENLSSGLSADVSGHLTIKYLYHKYESDHMYNFEPKVAHYLFKLFDRGVKLLAPGTV